jgi:hypothetical protein
VTDLINQVTVKMGGQPVEGHLIHTNGRHAHHHEPHGFRESGEEMARGSERSGR